LLNVLGPRQGPSTFSVSRARFAGTRLGIHPFMTENQNGSSEDQQGYDPGQDPDSDPEMLASAKKAKQPDQAEGEDFEEPDGSGS
jgi:hypothetical protein